MGPFARRHDHGIADDEKNNPDDDKRHDVHRRDHGARRRQEVLLKRPLGFRFGFRRRIFEEFIDGFGHSGRVLRIDDAHDVPADIPGAPWGFLAQAFVDIFMLKHHDRRIDGLIPGAVDRAHHERPLTGINIAVEIHDVADFKIVAARQVDADDAAVALALEGVELLLVN